MRLFISYRRADTQTLARSMKTFLDQIPRIDQVFLDFDEIGVGEDFEAEIQAALARSSHCLVLIGPDYLGTHTAQGEAARILQPGDFVRREAASALSSTARVIPVLIDGTDMPDDSDLPDDLKRLPRLNAFQLRTSHFEDDMDDLLDVVFARKSRRGSRWKRPRLGVLGGLGRAAVGLGIAGALVFAAALVNSIFQPFGCSSLDCTVSQGLSLDYQSSVAVMISAILAILAIGAVTPFLPRLLDR